MRILITSVGRRGYLVRYFREALGPGDEVWGADCSPLAPAFKECHNALLLPEVHVPEYCDRLLELCRQYQIRMIIPTIDPGLSALAPHRVRFLAAGVMAVVSAPATIEIGFDKYLTYLHCKAHGIPVPLTVQTVAEAEQLLAAGQFRWPLVVKPRKGSASADISFCQTLEELKVAFATCPLPMIQETMPGQEYGYDIFGGPDGPVSVLCKKKLAMRAGETDKAVSVDDPALLDLGLRLARSLEIFGPLDADVKLDAAGQGRLLEFNPRFGGGYPCAHLCGADFPRKLVRLARGLPVPPELDQPRRAGVYMLKEDEIICRSQAMVEATHDLRGAGQAASLGILFTSVGRRVGLLQQFRRAANNLGVLLRLHAVDCSLTAPAVHVADAWAQCPPVLDAGYGLFLLEYCRRHQVTAVVPLIDTELDVLATLHQAFREAGTRLVLSSPEVVRTSLDKVLTAEFLTRHGLDTPRVMTEEDLRRPKLPLFMKARVGSASKGTRKIETLEELDFYRRAHPDFLVQEFIAGQEYTLDVFTDFDGRPLCAVPRQRLEVRGGETSKGRVALHARMAEGACQIIRALGGCQGMLTIQCFHTPDGRVVFTEINPRFGGGVPLSIAAGADSPRWLLELLLGRTPSVALSELRDGLMMLRYDSAFFVMPEALESAGQVPVEGSEPATVNDTPPYRSVGP